MRRIIFIMLFILVNTVTICAQEYNIPKDYKFETKEAYKTYESQIKETIEWLLQTPLGKEANKRRDAFKFLMDWIDGTPNVTVGLDQRIINFISVNPEMLVPFLSGWVKYSLDNDYSKDNIQCNKAGVEAVVTFYRKNKGYLKKDGNIEKYEKLIEKGKLEEEISKKLKK